MEIVNKHTDPLTNPVICLSFTSVSDLTFLSSILPPDLVDGYATRNNNVSKGWKYATSDWNKEWSKKGRVWIHPIQHFPLQPKTTAFLPIVQITMNHSVWNEYSNIRIVASVYFKELPYPICSRVHHLNKS